MKSKRTLLAIFLTLTLTMTLMPLGTLAAWGSEDGNDQVTTQTVDDETLDAPQNEDAERSTSDNTAVDAQENVNSGAAGKDDTNATTGNDPATIIKKAKKKASVSAQEIKESYGTPVDFTKYIKEATVQRMGSTETTWSDVTDDNPVKSGDDVKFILDYTLDAGTLDTAKDHSNRTNTITYTVTPPIGKILPESGEVKNGDGKVIGKYTINPIENDDSKTGLITIIFDESYVDGNRGTRVPSTISFTSSVDGWKDKDEGVEEVPIGGSVGDIEIIIQPEDATGDIKIKKSYTKFNNATGDITYTMDVTSTSGTKTDVIVTDTMVLEVIKGQGNFKVTKTSPVTTTDPETGEESTGTKTENVTWKSLTNNRTPAETKFHDADGDHDNGFIMTLAPLNPGEKYTITYEAYYPKLVNGSVSVKNTAIARSFDESDKLLISTSTQTNTLSDKPLDKTGVLTEDVDISYEAVSSPDAEGNPKEKAWYEKDGDDYKLTDDETVEAGKTYYERKETGTGSYFIEWTVTINPSKVDISGWSLKDTGLYNYKKDKDGNPSEDLSDKYLSAKDVTLIKKGTGEEKDTTISLGDIKLDGTKTLYTFPDNTTSTYVLKYTTAMSFDDANFEANNSIKMDPPPGDQDNEDNSPTSAPPGIKGIDTEKDHKDMEVDLETGEAWITWTITFSTTAGTIPANSIFSDELGDKQEFADKEELKKAIENAFAEYGGVDWEKVKDGDAEVDSPSNTKFAFKTKSQIPQGKEITFNYKAKVLDFDVNAQNTYENKATLKNPDGETIGNPSDKVTYKPAINKYDSSNGKKTTGEDRTTSHYVGEDAVTYGDNTQTIKWGFDVNLPASYYNGDAITDYVVLRDELPKGLTAKYLAFDSYVFEGIEGATKDNPVKKEISVSDWIASSSDVNNGYAKKAGDKISDASEFTIEAWVEKSGDGSAVFVKIPKDAITYYKSKTYEFNLYAEIDANWNWGKNERKIKETSFENNVFLIPDSTDVENSVTDSKHTQTIINDENARAIIKGNLYDANESVRDVPYRVIVNEEGKTLLDGKAKLDFKDTMTAEYPWGVSITLVPGSFKVYEVDKSSISYTDSAKKKVDEDKLKKTKDITDQVQYQHDAGRKSGDTWTITAKLPDGKALLVEYDYHMSGYTTGRERVKLHNTSELGGVATDSNNGEISDEMQLQKSDAMSDLMRMTLEKVDSSNNNNSLQGAEFDLYVYTGSKYLYIATLKTDKDGKFNIDDETFADVDDPEAIQDPEEGILFNFNTAYRLIETKAPANYELDTTPSDFVIMDRSQPLDFNDLSSAEYIPNDFDGFFLGLGTAYVYFDNVYHPYDQGDGDGDGDKNKKAKTPKRTALTRTGDSFPLWIILIVLLASATTAFIVSRRKGRQE